MHIFQWIEMAKQQNASDLLLSVGSPPLIRVNGALTQIDSYAASTGEDVKAAFMQITRDSETAGAVNIVPAEFTDGNN